MEIIKENNDIILSNQPDFELNHIFDCGQCFRFNRLDDGSYLGTAYDKTIRISKEERGIVFHNTSEEDFENIWYDYFDLDTDYGEIKKRLTIKDDAIMRDAVNYGNGIRILNQDLWETLISFIISASNNIPRIKKIIELLAKNFGEPHQYCGNTYYSFPNPEKIAVLKEEELAVIRAGFRNKYILDCAKNVVLGKINLEAIKSMSTAEAKKALMNIKGVGNKVSDCVLLFSMARKDAFPIDVWIKRITEYCYFGGNEETVGNISKFAASRFGELGGMAQQYLFFYAREKKIGVEKAKT